MTEQSTPGSDPPKEVRRLRDSEITDMLGGWLNDYRPVRGVNSQLGETGKPVRSQLAADIGETISDPHDLEGGVATYADYLEEE